MNTCLQRSTALCSTHKMEYCTNTVSAAVLMELGFFFLFYLRFIPSVNHLRNHYAIFSCSKDLPKHTEYRSLNLIPAPINELHDSVTNRFLAPYPSLNPHISHPSLSLSVSLYLLFLTHLCSQCQGLYAQYF